MKKHTLALLGLTAATILLGAEMIWAESHVEGRSSVTVTRIATNELETTNGSWRSREAVLNNDLRPGVCKPETAAQEFCLTPELLESLRLGDSLTCEDVYRVGVLKKRFGRYRRDCKKST